VPIDPSEPEYIVTGVAQLVVHDGLPRSWSSKVSLAENGGEAGVSTRLSVANVSVAGTLPLLAMSTVAELVAPGLIGLTVSIEVPGSESVTVTEPLVMRVLGLAEVELKFAPVPAATAVATISAPSAITSRRGEAVTNQMNARAIRRRT
jgi:hypothetical protein